MVLYSTNNKNNRVSLKEAVMQGLPNDRGLFMPSELPLLPKAFMEELPSLSFQEIAYTVCKNIIGDEIPSEHLQAMITAAVNFPAPVEMFDEKTGVLELFHGPSLAFKDFGAQFMAQIMSYFNQDNDRELTILVATSGDTGGAVAAGFYEVAGINVIILYPNGKVSALQEQQLTTFGKNVTAISVEGTFDDCQAIVKQAFVDAELTKSYQLASANSINIARLIPQSFYYFEAFKQVTQKGTSQKDVVFVVPSGNFGNLTAGLFAKRMGLRVEHFVAATNMNDIVPKYLETGVYAPRPSTSTISSAMDVGAPSNFARILALYGASVAAIRSDVAGWAFDDAATRRAILEVYQQYNYIIDPHGAVAYLGCLEYQRQHPQSKAATIALGTAHYGKFKSDMDVVLGFDVPVPAALTSLLEKESKFVTLSNRYEDFKAWMLSERAG